MNKYHTVLICADAQNCVDFLTCKHVMQTERKCDLFHFDGRKLIIVEHTHKASVCKCWDAFTHSREFWVNKCAHTLSGASAPTRLLLIEWQSHYAKRLAPWEFLTNTHTRLVFLLRFFISLPRSSLVLELHSVSFQTGYITRSLNLIIHKWARFHSRTQSADVQHHRYTVSQWEKNANSRTRFPLLICSHIWQE